MSTITIDDETREALEASAAEHGMSLPDYLRLVAGTYSRPGGNSADGRSLAESLAPAILAAGRKKHEPRPASADTSKAAFDAVMTEKYRKQGFNL